MDEYHALNKDGAEVCLSVRFEEELLELLSSKEGNTVASALGLLSSIGQGFMITLF
jgi:hypothetical protein